MINGSQLARLLELDWLIRNHRYPNATRLADHQEVTEKTVRRDIAYLKNCLNAPISYCHTNKGYYYKKADWRPPLLQVAMAMHEMLDILQSPGEPAHAAAKFSILKEIKSGGMEKIFQVYDDENGKVSIPTVFAKTYVNPQRQFGMEEYTVSPQ